MVTRLNVASLETEQVPHTRNLIFSTILLFAKPKADTISGKLEAASHNQQSVFDLLGPVVGS